MCSLAALARGCRPAAANKPCCLCWCCCCSCSWARCLAERNSDGGPGKKPGEFGPQEPLLNDADATPTLDEIQSWGQSFDRLMRSAAGRTVFRDFLRGEYSEENIMFWLACEELKRETDPDAVEEKARFIYEDYISILSPKEVSLDSRVREVVNRNMVEPTPHTFDDAQLQIYTLMHRDSYPRFVNSQVYKKMAHLLSAEPASANPATPAALESSGTPASPASPALVTLVAPVAPDEPTTTHAHPAPPVPAAPLVPPVPAAPVTPPMPAAPLAPQLPATPVATPVPAAPVAPPVPAAPVVPPVPAAPVVPPVLAAPVAPPVPAAQVVPPVPAAPVVPPVLAAPVAPPVPAALLAPPVPAAPLAPPGQVQPAQ